MVQVQLQNFGDGLPHPFLLPVSLPAAQTLAKAARTLNLADEVSIVPSAGPPAATPARVDLQV
jgi:hypothetical protein